MSGLINTSVPVSVNIKLGEKGQGLVRLVIVLMSLDVFILDFDLGALHCEHDSFDNIPVGLESSVRAWISNFGLFLDSGY